MSSLLAVAHSLSSSTLTHIGRACPGAGAELHAHREAVACVTACIQGGSSMCDCVHTGRQ